MSSLTIKCHKHSDFFKALPQGSIVVLEMFGRDRKVKARHIGFRFEGIRWKWYSKAADEIFEWLETTGYEIVPNQPTAGVYQMINPGDPDGVMFKMRWW